MGMMMMMMIDERGDVGDVGYEPGMLLRESRQPKQRLPYGN